MKTCSACGQPKPLDEFHRRTKARDGRASACKVCASGYAKKWRIANLDRSLAASANWKAENRARNSAKNREHYLANRARLREQGRAWYEANREARRVSKRAWHTANPSLASERRARRRARRYGSPVETVDLEALWTGFCAICHRPMARVQAWPHPESPSVDHITPLAKGGVHEQTNLQWAHLRCNLRKGARSTEGVS